MADSVQNILSRLEPISDKVTRRPLRDEEIQALEAAVGVPMPSCAREYFRNVGLFQDLTAYGASEYEALEHLDQFREDRKLLVRYFGPAAANLFPFAGDGAGDIIAVAEGAEGGMLFFADHETHEIKKIGAFSDWLSSVVETALKKERPANNEKRWCVQFTFRAPAPDPILAAMRRLGIVSLGGWSAPKVSPSDVHSSEASLVFGKERLTLKRSEYRTWEQPMFSLDFNEPANLAASVSMVRKLDTAFRQADLAYKLVDYGPLSSGWEKEEPAFQATRASFASFWNWLTRPL
jgi:hypothetical protein